MHKSKHSAPVEQRSGVAAHGARMRECPCLFCSCHAAPHNTVTAPSYGAAGGVVTRRFPRELLRGCTMHATSSILLAGCMNA